MGLLKMMGRSSHKEHKKDESASDWSIGSPTSPVHGSSPFIGRPPPLDPRIEADLRKSCAVVLQNLKPSGHDVEDTRMRADIMLEENDRDANAYKTFGATRQQPGQQKPAEAAEMKKSHHSSTAWVVSSDENQPGSHTSTMVNPNNVFKASERRNTIANNQPATVASTAPQLSASILSHLPPAQDQLKTQVAVPESPAAPLSSPRLMQRLDSSSTIASTQLTNSTDQPGSASTAVSSAPFTPARSSKRMSGSLSSQLADPARNRSSQKESDLMRPSGGQMTALEAILKSPQMDYLGKNAPSASQPQSTVARPVAGPVAAAPNIPGRSSSTYSRPSEDTTRPARSPGPASAAFDYAGPNKQSSIGSKRTSQNDPLRPSSKDGLRQSAISPLSINQMDRIPPVPRLTEERLNSLGGSIRAPTYQPSLNTDLPSPRLYGDQSNRLRDEKLVDLRDKSDEPLATTRARLAAGLRPGSGVSVAGNTPIFSTAADHNRRLSGHTPLPRYPISPTGTGGSRKNSLKTHQYDPSVTIRDFYKPSIVADSKQPWISNGSTSPTSASQEASSYGSMLDRPHPAQVNRQEIEPPTTTRTSSILRAVANVSSSPPPASPILPVRRSSMNPATNGVVDHRPTTAPEPAVNGTSHVSKPSYSRASQPQSIASPVRHSESVSRRTPSMKSKTEKRGLSKLFWKLGGGDMPARRKIYIPPELKSARHREDEYWSDDDEACAAPVIGFGRGW